MKVFMTAIKRETQQECLHRAAALRELPNHVNTPDLLFLPKLACNSKGFLSYIKSGSLRQTSDLLLKINTYRIINVGGQQMNRIRSRMVATIPVYWRVASYVMSRAASMLSEVTQLDSKMRDTQTR